MNAPLLQLIGLTKTFGSKVANDNIDLVVQAGKVHAIVGENGAGKTTLMSLINGTGVPDSGQILFDGKPVRITSPKQADALGIGMVFQHFKLVGSLSVAANVFLGREKVHGLVLDQKGMEAEVRRLSEQFGLEVDPTEITRDLSVGEAQRVEVLKALSHETRLLILDEPTAVLTPQETDDMFVVIRDLAKQGVAVVFISHKLDEVLAIADEVTVIRDGRSIATLPAAGLSKADIASMMVGREVLLRIEHTPANPGDEVLRVDDLVVVDERGITTVNHLSLSVRAGEIVGIAGVEGNGQSELTAVVAGMLKPNSGSVTLKGADMTTASVRQRRDAGLAYIPEDRHHVGTAPKLSLAENVGATHLVPPVATNGWISTTSLRALADALIAKFDIRGAHAGTPVGSLSGGNMQKVVIAREFESDPTVLVVSQPTRGVDVGAMEFVHNALVAARDRGAGVLLVSADLNEVMSLSDRLLVMHRGHIISEFTQETMSETAVGLAMAGVDVDDDAVALAEQKRAEKAALVSRDLEVAHEADPAISRDAIADTVASAAAEVSDAAAEPVVTAEVAEPVDLAAVARDTQRRGPSGREVWQTLIKGAVQPLAALAAALLVGAVIIVLLGKDPVSAYIELFFGSLTTPYGIGALVSQAIPLLVLAASVIISFRAGFFNIGGEGQLYMGAFFASISAIAVKDSVPAFVTILVAIVVGTFAGMLWGLLPGWLLAMWNANIIVTTLMLSTIAILFTAFMVSPGRFLDPSVGTNATRQLNPDNLLPVLSPEYGIGLDLFLALAVAIVLGLILTRSTWGLKVRELGEMNRFAEYTGVNPKSMSMQVMALSGAVAGFAGALFILGQNSQGGRFLQTFSPGYGFLALTVALLARLNPWASIATAFFYANMMAGANQMQINAGVPYQVQLILQALIILTVTATVIAVRFKKRPTTTSPPSPAATLPPPAPTKTQTAATEGTAA
ncbi:MAG TPA: ATP-binding cassette domain-containing protein [Propionibacteriaceae bacterium]|nr:ATP-binding cassette domain-containing protein [Propionibacteriaceae bacterium]